MTNSQFIILLIFIMSLALLGATVYMHSKGKEAMLYGMGFGMGLYILFMAIIMSR